MRDVLCTIFGCGGACTIAAKAASEYYHKNRDRNKGRSPESFDLALFRRAQVPFRKGRFGLEQLTYGNAGGDSRRERNNKDMT